MAAGGAIGRGLGVAIGAIVAFALPPRCAGCGAIQAEDHRFCLACWQALGLGAAVPACPRCALPIEAHGAGTEPCGACLADPPPYDAARAAVPYGPIARGIALRLKHGRRIGLAETMARQMLRLVPPGDPPLLVPVPLHRRRIWWRGYNQAALIAARLAKAGAGTLAVDLLRRDRPTPLLRGLGARHRAAAVRGAFSTAPGAAIEGRRVILVDDVLTSGATAAACARALRRAGAARIEVIVWARVNRPGSGGFDI